ncbi:hypothetical protein [Enterococcus sp. AZ196]|uniref:hypothetical protein n=1 Tax=Enterococcus sp. AZ196 TaxID=2774659 RepID=UPI003D284449
MAIIYFIGIILVLLVINIAIILSRIYLQDQLNYAKKTNPESISFQRKFSYIQQKIVAKHSTWLLIISASLTVCLILMVFVIFQLSSDNQAAMKRLAKAEEETVKLTQQQEDIINQSVIQSYPQKGIGIADYNWEEVFGEKGKEQQASIEGELSQSMAPYFGSTTALTMVEVSSQKLTIAFASNPGAKHNKKLVLDNITALVKEAEGINQLTQINFQAAFKEGEEKEDYQCSYQRENGDAQFQLISKENEGNGE